MKIRERMEFHKYSQAALRITAGAVVTKDVPANAIDGGGLYLVTAAELARFDKFAAVSQSTAAVMKNPQSLQTAMTELTN